MKSFRMPPRVVFDKEDERWIAHCLEFDLLGDGETRETAIESLSGAIVTQPEASIAFGNMENLFTPEDGPFFQMFAAGKTPRPMA